MPPKPSTAAKAKPQPEPAEGSRTLGVLKESLGFRLRRIQNHLAETFGKTLAERNLRSGEFSALALIAANPGISQIDLSREGGFDKASVVAMLDDLERWGWATRQRSTQDRRRHSLFVTPAGDQALAELAALAKKNEAAIHTALTDAELATLFDMLDRIYDRCFNEEPG